MKDYERQISRLRGQIAKLSNQLAQLEKQQQAYGEQCERRLAFLSSREILDLLAARQGRSGSIATIKRWADSGYLGEVVDEREVFPLLAGKQGNKRFLYPREAVYRYLHEKGLLRPAFDILDRVLLAAPSGSVRAVVTASERHGDRFTYQVQLEESGEVLTEVAEADLTLP